MDREGGRKQKVYTAEIIIFQIKARQMADDSIKLWHQQQEPRGEEEKCLICCSKIKHDRYFAACGHKSTCLKCAEELMKEYVSKKKWPRCLHEDCGAKMVTNGKLCIFQYFSKEATKIWEQYVNNPEENSLPNEEPCKRLNCKGIIVGCRCTKCNTHYCEICMEVSHLLGQSCKKANQLQIEGLKQCPNCRTNYVRDEGCHHVTCLNCHHEFCEVCQDRWNFRHHSCRLADLVKSEKPKVKKPTGCCCIF